MKDICLQCHTPPLVDRVYKEGDAVVDATNEKVLAARAIMDGLKSGRPALDQRLQPADPVHLF